MIRKEIICALYVLSLLVWTSSGDTNIVQKWNEIAIQQMAKEGLSDPLVAQTMALVHESIAESFFKTSVVDGSPSDSTDPSEICKREFQKVVVVSASRFILVSLNSSRATTSGSLDHDAIKVLKNAFDTVTSLQSSSSSCSPSLVLTLVQQSETVARKLLSSYFTNTGIAQFQDYVLNLGKEPSIAEDVPPSLTIERKLPLFGKSVLFGGIGRAQRLIPTPPPKNGQTLCTITDTDCTIFGFNNTAGRVETNLEKANFWAGSIQLSTLTGVWNLVASQMISARISTVDVKNTNLVFQMMNYASADSSLIAVATKYKYNNVSPLTTLFSIFSSPIDTNPDLHPVPFIVPYPEYVSLLTSISSSSARILSLSFGEENILFNVTSLGSSGQIEVRHFEDFAQAAEDQGGSRVLSQTNVTKNNLQSYTSSLFLGVTIADDIFQKFSDEHLVKQNQWAS